ncbi:MAG: sulfatase [Acidobacteria bacterium]|nr:sulfatase [Acidobacteriota bacterium]
MISRRAFLSACGAAAAQPRRRKPNVILLFADDMGYGDLACYGHPTIRTPNLDRMAAEGLRCTSFYAAAPFCTPSRVGLLTGRYPLRAGLPNNLGPDSKNGLPLSEILLSQHLKANGYRTMAIGKWHLGHNPEAYLPTSRGFDSYFGLLYSNDMEPPFVKTEVPLKLYRNTEPVEHPVRQATLTERYTDEAVKFIKASGANPFFLYLPYAMPHLPISASSRLGTSRAGLYGDVIETIDWSAGEILKTLKEQKIDNNTLVVFMSDNGPWLDLPSRMLANENQPWHTGFKSLLRGHKGNTYEGGPRVPGIFRFPGTIPAAQVSADIAATIDVFPTVCTLAGVSLPTDRHYDGIDLSEFLKGRAASPRKNYFYFRGPFLEAYREGAWKVRLDKSKPELFNLDDDPAEQYDRYDRNKDLGDRLLTKLRDFAKELKAQLPAV